MSYNDNYYGFSSTDYVSFAPQGFPVGLHKVMVTSEEPYVKEGRLLGFVATLEVVEGKHKGYAGKNWFLTMHSNPTTAKIAQQNVKRIADATGRPITPSAPMKGRVFYIDVGIQKKDENRTEIKKFYPESHTGDDTPF